MMQKPAAITRIHTVLWCTSNTWKPASLSLELSMLLVLATNGDERQA